MVVLRSLIDADGRVTLGEYCLARLIGVQVIDALNPAATQASGRLKLPGLSAEVKDLLAIVAHHGHDDAADAQRAYALAIAEVLPDASLNYAPPSEWGFALDRALPQLDRLAPAGKELVVRALTRAIGADGRVSVAEAELLRTVCAGPALSAAAAGGRSAMTAIAARYKEKCDGTCEFRVLLLDWRPSCAPVACSAMPLCDF